MFDDADVNAAVAGAMASKNRNARQTGVCANRLYVQSAIHDAFVAEPIGAVGKPKVGNCEEEDALIGPLIDEAAVAKAQEHVDDALAKGGKVEAVGKALGD